MLGVIVQTATSPTPDPHRHAVPEMPLRTAVTVSTEMHLVAVIQTRHWWVYAVSTG